MRVTCENVFDRMRVKVFWRADLKWYTGSVRLSTASEGNDISTRKSVNFKMRYGEKIQT